LATWDYEPTKEQVEFSFGPGDYEILIAREGVIGLMKVKDVSIMWTIEYVGWVNGEPKVDYIKDNYGIGNYFVLTNCKATPFQIFPTGQPHDLAWQHLQDGATTMSSVSIIFRVKMPWV
jgi:hypothetical protein